RSEEDAGTECGRLLAQFPQQHRGRVGGIADQELAVLLTNRPPPRVDAKERKAVVLRLHLRGITARRQFRSGGCGKPGRLAWCRELARKDIRNDGLRSRIRRVVDDEAAIAERPLEPTAEGLRHPDTRSICFAELFE